MQRFRKVSILTGCALLTLAGLFLCLPRELRAQAQEKVVNAYNTMFGLQLANPNFPNNVVVVQGLTNANDGYGGVFAYDPTSSATVNLTNVFKPANFNGRWIRCWNIPVTSGLLPFSLTGLQSGSNTNATDGTVTNTFASVFSELPSVVTTPANNATPTNTVVSITKSNFVYSSGVGAMVFHWVAVGSP